MPRKSRPESQEPPAQRQSRRNFLARFGLGAAALAATTVPLLGRGSGGGDAAGAGVEDEFPGEDSIFHPAVDPRLDPRRHG